MIDIVKELCGFSDKFGGEVSLTCNTDDGYHVKISARKMTEEEIEKIKSENEKEEEEDDV